MSNLPTVFQGFIFSRTYARYLEKEGRRETFVEAVQRYRNFFAPRVPAKHRAAFDEAVDAIVHLEVMPSMRALWTAGVALERENVCAYNCSYIPIEHPKSFAELLYILMCGTGVGFSVERQYMARLPTIPAEIKTDKDIKPIVFADSKLGWAEGFYRFVSDLFAGNYTPYDLSKIRPKGSPLKTFGGRASGPEPLKQLLDFTARTFQGAVGRKLNSVECYDICCMVANVVVAGGVRRSATISLSNFSDRRMAHVKDGDFDRLSPWRRLSNNSVAYTERPDCITFMEEWMGLAKSGTGERGIFNREGAQKIVKAIGRRDPEYDFGCNPCSEIILRPYEFCNLSEVVVRRFDDEVELSRKVRRATILGCVQATLTKFGFINYKWAKNCEEERLLGVSLTGLRDHEILGHVNDHAKILLRCLREVAQDTARQWSEILGINMPAAITCVKPSGTVSKLVNSASGMHPRHSPYYIQRVRVAMTDPIAAFLIHSGVQWNPEVGESRDQCTTGVFDFPVKAPEGAKGRGHYPALEQLEYWKMLQENWCEHKPSCTIYVKPHEWLKVGAWVYENWESVSGISFLPYDGGVYQLPPYEEISREKYEELCAQFPDDLDFAKLKEFETEDNTSGSTEFACVGGACDL